jgi:two-component system response regulator AtoC
MRRLLTWVDSAFSRPPERLGPDQGPVLRLLQAGGVRYDEAIVLCTREGRHGARTLVAVMQREVEEVELRVLDVSDPSDHAQLFEALGPVLAQLPTDGELDVLLSAGTPQAQTLWVVLVQAGLLRARMLQVIPPRFVPVPHPEPVREVRLDIEGFPEIRALREEVVRLRARVAEVAPGLVGASPPMVRLRERLARLAPSDLPVIVLGETGVGKELVARALHEASGRAEGPFVAESCGAVSESLAESELFGHVEGAFTGAMGRHRGLFEQAHGGTLLLDEVGELSPRLQVRLLRVLQEGEVRPVGAEKSMPVDVRVIAATHRDLRAEVQAGRFREDLYYRLRGAELIVPPLRDRPGDLELLVAHFLHQAGSSLRVGRSAWERLAAHTWPGNVRELAAEVRRWTVLCDEVVGVEDLGFAVGREVVAVPVPAAGGVQTLDEAVEAAVRTALAASGGNLSAAARVLGVDRNTLKRKLERMGLR